MHLIFILQRQLWLLLMVMLSMITAARSPLEMLSSSVRAIQQLSRYSDNSEITTIKSPPPQMYQTRVLFPSTLLLLSPVWNKRITANRREDMDYAESNHNDKKHSSQQIMVAWPARLTLPSNKNTPLRFLTAMAVPINTDPLLTKGELSEVVYYTNMDLRKLNISDNNSNNKLVFTGNIEQEDDDASYEYDDSSTESQTTLSDKESYTVKPYYSESAAVPTSTIVTPPLANFISTPVPRNEDHEERSWPHQGVSPRAAVGGERHWMDGESVAYIAVGTCCGLSVLTLAIVLLVLRVRGRKRQLEQTTQSSDTYSESSDDLASIQLPQKLINLLNSRSQEVSTHKLGSWFNGRPTTLSIRHGGNMAFPAPVRRFQENSDEIQEVTDRENPDEMLEITNSTNYSIDEEPTAVPNIYVSNEIRCDVDFSMDPVEEETESRDDSVAGSKHDTFIFWSTNSDRLV